MRKGTFSPLIGILLALFLLLLLIYVFTQIILPQGDVVVNPGLELVDGVAPALLVGSYRKL